MTHEKYIAKDSIRAILTKGIRTIYNTHMHKLAFDIEDMNGEHIDENCGVFYIGQQRTLVK